MTMMRIAVMEAHDLETGDTFCTSFVEDPDPQWLTADDLQHTDDGRVLVEASDNHLTLPPDQLVHVLER